MPAPVSLSLFRVPITRPAHLRPLRLKHADDVRQPGHQNRVVQTLSNERTKRLTQSRLDVPLLPTCFLTDILTHP